MYEFLRCSVEQPRVAEAEMPEAAPAHQPAPVVVHMRENRSHLTRDARICFAVIGALFIVTSIGPAIHGHLLVPVFSILALSALTFGLERHARAVVPSEVLELTNGLVRYRDSTGRAVEFAGVRVRLAAERRSPTDFRLFLHGRSGSVEFGRCLSLRERREVAPKIEAALIRLQGG